jgi:hypothetical protein
MLGNGRHFTAWACAIPFEAVGMNIKGFLVTCIVFSVGIFCPLAWGASPLKYQFKGQPEAVYRFTIRAEYPDYFETNSGMLTYHIKAVDPANGQIQFSYTSDIHQDKQQKQPQNNQPGFPGFPPMPPPFLFPFGSAKASPDILISPAGKVLRSNSNDDGSQLPHMLGYAWQLMLQPLAEDGGQTWKSQRALVIYTKSKPQPQWPPRGPFGQQQPETRVDHPATETVTFTAGQPNGSLIPIQRQYELATDEKVGNSPLLKQSGQGQFMFDTESGMIQSMEMTYSTEANENNVTVRIPISVRVTLLTPKELADLKAQQEAAAKAEKARADQEQFWADGQAKAVENTVHTPLVGDSDGGNPFTRVEPQQRPVIGVRFTTGDWSGHKCIRQIEPLYEKPADPATGDSVDVMAKPGYAMGGLVVSSDTHGDKAIWAMQVIFMRLDNGHLVKSDPYRGHWIGGIKETLPKIVLGNKGETVVGFFGRQGLNVDGIGLILKDPNYQPKAGQDETAADETPADAAPADASAQLKLIEAGWQKTTAKAVDITAQLHPAVDAFQARFGHRFGGGANNALSKDEDGNLLLSRGGRLASTASYQTPVTFRIVCMSDVKDFRVGYAADQIIFNWEMDPDQMRVDGGPASGQHMKGFGRLPANQWVGIEIAVHPAELLIYVNGKRRYRADGDFSSLHKPFTIEAHNDTLKIKSISVVR